LHAATDYYKDYYNYDVRSHRAWRMLSACAFISERSVAEREDDSIQLFKQKIPKQRKKKSQDKGSLHSYTRCDALSPPSRVPSEATPQQNWDIRVSFFSIVESC
jgi:hypothetical protein